MWFLNIITDIGTGILIGYLTMTNFLSDSIESVFTNEPDVVEEITTPDSLSKIPTANNEEFIPKILLENQGFQQAAVLASSLDETNQTEEQNIPLETLVRESLVNVYCQYRTQEYIRTTTGSGFFINPKGVIITNAHVAQFLLLEDNEKDDVEVECIIRTGNPAEPKYEANLLYISPTWIFENSDLITQESPRGTGERDYALLYVSNSIDNSPLPTRFPFMPVDTNLLPRGVAGTSVVTAGYPAEELLINGADAKLPLVFAESSVGELYTFGSNYADIFSINDSEVGEHGASGGPIVSENNNKAIGLIVTKGDEEVEGARSLRALTLSYIDRTMLDETGFSLMQNMQGDVAYRGNIFKNVMTPFLAEILQEEIDQ